MIKPTVLFAIFLLASCQNRVVESKSNLKVEKKELMRRIEVAKVQVEASEQITDIFDQIRFSIRQLSSLVSVGSKAYTPFDTLKQIFDEAGTGIPKVEDKNKYIFVKKMTAPLYLKDCEEIEIYTKLEDQKPNTENLDLKGQKLSYALKGCQFKEKATILEVNWNNKGFNFNIVSKTYEKLLEQEVYSERYKNLLGEKTEAKDMTCETQGKIFEQFKFNCENIQINVFSNDLYVHFIIIEKLSYNSESFLRFELLGKNYSSYQTKINNKFETVLDETNIFVKIYETGEPEMELTPVLESLQNNPKVKGLKGEVTSELNGEEGLSDAISIMEDESTDASN